jgi:hypothetical protein
MISARLRRVVVGAIPKWGEASERATHRDSRPLVVQTECQLLLAVRRESR